FGKDLPVRRERRLVQLEQDAGLCDGAVLAPHRLSDGVHVRLIRWVVLVAHEKFRGCRGKRGQAQLCNRLSRGDGLEISDVYGYFLLADIGKRACAKRALKDRAANT